MFARGLGDNARLGNRTGQRFFAIDVSSALQRCYGRDRMRVIGRADDHGVDVLLIEQTAEVIVGFRRGIFFLHRGEIVIVNVAQRDDVFSADTLQVFSRAVCHADHADVQPVVGREFSRVGLAAGQPDACCGGSLPDKLASIQRMDHKGVLIAATHEGKCCGTRPALGAPGVRPARSSKSAYPVPSSFPW